MTPCLVIKSDWIWSSKALMFSLPFTQDFLAKKKKNIAGSYPIHPKITTKVLAVGTSRGEDNFQAPTESGTCPGDNCHVVVIKKYRMLFEDVKNVNGFWEDVKWEDVKILKVFSRCEKIPISLRWDYCIAIDMQPALEHVHLQHTPFSW